MAPDAERWLKTVLKGIGQIAFCDNYRSGILVLGAIASLSLTSASAALFGSIAGTVVARVLNLRPEIEWREGLAGVNPAMLGLLWAGSYAADISGIGILILAVAGTIALDLGLSRIVARWHLPVLAVPAVLTFYGLAGLQFISGFSPWQRPAAPIQLEDIAPALALVFVALMLKSPRGAGLALSLAAIASLVSGEVYELGIVGPVGFWAFTVAPTAFAVHAVFGAGSRRGAILAIAASLMSTLLWIAWINSPLILAAPPTIVPMIIAIWCAVGVARRLWGPHSQNPALWYVVERMRRARRAGRPVVALTGAGISTASHIPDYVSGAWLDPQIPQSTYSFPRFLASPRCRRAYWDACSKFRDVAIAAIPNAGHDALAALQKRGFVTSIVTQNVDRLHQESGATDVIELHGRVDQVTCLSCRADAAWPPAKLWRRFDLRCKACGGLLKPAVIALAEDIPQASWIRARRAVTNCGVMIVIGSQLAISSAAALVAQARAEGALIVFFNIGPALTADFRADIMIPERVEEILPVLALLLDCPVRSKAAFEAGTVVQTTRPVSMSPTDGADSGEVETERQRQPAF